MIYIVCACGTSSRFENAEAAMKAGWQRLTTGQGDIVDGQVGGVENVERRWFCPSETLSTIAEALGKEADRWKREGRIREN